MVARPGQLEPNDLEVAILERLASKEPSLSESVHQLRVASREFTGCGSFTTFICEKAIGAPEQQIGLDAVISVPGVPSGMGAVLFCRGGKPECLEIYTLGDEHWDGMGDGFSIDATP